MEKTVRPRPEHEEGGEHVYCIPPEYVLIFNMSDLKQLKKDIQNDLNTEVFYHIDKDRPQDRCIHAQSLDGFASFNMIASYVRGWFRGCFPI